jgi:2,3-bisphosphoglycerate-dependent phosphoglycerate mutase
VIVRHGNTFRAGETPTRVGARTDLPLVEEERARSAGRYLRDRQGDFGPLKTHIGDR